jgi:hypothetical protein
LRVVEFIDAGGEQVRDLAWTGQKLRGFRRDRDARRDEKIAAET